MYGAFIMNKRQEWDIPTLPITLIEWTDMKPEEVVISLHAATDWFAIQKGTTQSYAEAIRTGHFNKKGENLRIILFNNSMMRHPMYLHGHDFRVLNGQGEYAPMKNVLDIMPMERDTIEFAASETGGDWFFHCHILYHMMSGMGRVFSYENSPPNHGIPDPKAAQHGLFRDDRMFHLIIIIKRSIPMKKTFLAMTPEICLVRSATKKTGKL